MSQQSNDKIARSLFDSSGREVNWPMVFAGVKNVARANNLNIDTLTCVKGWLKSNDSQLHIPLLGVTVLHTLSLNCSTVVRNQMASLKLFQRLEKQLSRPQGPQVATALVQLLSDWIYLFGQEELGARSQALLDQPRFRQIAVGCTPSAAVLQLQEDMKLGLPPVAPVRGEDFIKWMYRSASLNDRTPSIHASTSAGSIGDSPNRWPSVQSGALPGGAPPRITTQAVPELSKRMRADAQRMASALTACHTAARFQRQTELSAIMDAAYREAERCSQWRRRAQEYTQVCDDSEGLAAVLSATDEINRVLQAWQQFTSVAMFDMLRITVLPRPLAEALPHPKHPQNQHQEQARTNPFTSGPGILQPLALMTTAPKKGTTVSDLLIDDSDAWLPPPQQQPASASASAKVVATPSVAVVSSRQPASSLSSPYPIVDTTVASFSQDRGVPSWVGGANALQAGSQRNLQQPGGPVSPSADSAVSTRSASPPVSTPGGTSAVPSSSYMQPFHDLWAAATAPPSRSGVEVTGPYPAGPTPGTVSSAAPADRNTTSGHNGSCSNGQVSSAHILEWKPDFDRLASDLRALFASSGLGSPMPPPSGTSMPGRASGAGTVPGGETLLLQILTRVRSMCEALSAKHERQMAAAVAAAQPSTPLPFSASTDAAVGRDVAGSHSYLKMRPISSISDVTSAGGAAADAAGATHGVVGDGPTAVVVTLATPATGSLMGFGADNRFAPTTNILNQPAMHNKQPPPHLQRPNGTSLAGSGRPYEDSLI